MPDVTIGADAVLDDGVIVGYPSGRTDATTLRVGRRAHLRSATILYLGSTIGDGLETGHHVVIREGCEVGDDCRIWSNSVVDYGCRLGSGVKIHVNCYVAQFTQIDDDAFLAPGVMIANDLYPGNDRSAALMSGPHIGAGAQLGVNVTVLPFVRIGEGALIGAGSVVTRDVPPRCVAYGSPAQVRGEVDELADIDGRIGGTVGSASRFRLVGRGAAGGDRVPHRSSSGTIGTE